MEIKPPTPTLQTPTKHATSVTPVKNNPINISTPVNWQISQHIEAVILKISDKQILLDIQGTKVHSDKPDNIGLKVGDILKLQIEQLKPTAQFKIINFQTAQNISPLANALKNSHAISDATFTPLLKSISYVANRPALRPSPLAIDVNIAVRDIFKNIPAPYNLKTGLQVKTQLQNSGIFIENKIENKVIEVMAKYHNNSSSNIEAKLHSLIKPILENDLSAKLHRLANLIKLQVPITTNSTRNTNNQTVTPAATITSNANSTQHVAKEIIEQTSLQNIIKREDAMLNFLRQVESGLNHIQQTQHQNINDAQSGRPTWLMELPIKDGQDIDLFQFKINEEESKNKQEGETKIWNVTLQFNLKGLGEIKTQIRMQSDSVSALFFSEKTSTLALFRNNFDFLRSRLNYNGLNVGSIGCENSAAKPMKNAPSHLSEVYEQHE